MKDFNKAIDRIKKLECPTGELENRITSILEDYQVASRDEITINREETLDRGGAEAYIAEISNDSNRSFIVLAKSGLDDYVAKVVDVYKN